MLIGHGPSRVRSESIRSCYVKAGQGGIKDGQIFFFQLKIFQMKRSVEKKKSVILEG
jgi:hypothetical protein